MFLEAYSFPRASLSENCSLLGTDMSGDKYPSIFSRQMKAIVYILYIVFISLESSMCRYVRNDVCNF